MAIIGKLRSDYKREQSAAPSPPQSTASIKKIESSSRGSSIGGGHERRLDRGRFVPRYHPQSLLPISNGTDLTLCSIR
jgi:hypothetical protein